ncbi:MAG: LacI family transcriptional regulator [Firmicutes bacterium]|nr:LacI family transcriptional regulator [Bacillota bacterium]
MGKGKVTIATIAEILNVSPITVSRALSNRPGVSDELRQIIKAKAQELGYRKPKCNDKINVLLLVRRRYVEDNSNFSYKVQGIEKYIRECNAQFTMEFVDQESHDKLVLPYNLSKQCFDGAILLGSFSDDYAKIVNKQVDNIVVFNNYCYNTDCDHVYYDFNKAGYRGAKYLIEKGHTKIGFIGVEGVFANPQRYLGYRTALEQRSLEVYEEHIIHHRDQITEVIPRLAQENNLPTAFLCESDRCALKVVQILYELKIRVPEQVSVIGLGNSDMAQIATPSLTTFDLNIDFACHTVVKMLLNRINADEPLPYQIACIDTVLVERQSVAAIKKP